MPDQEIQIAKLESKCEYLERELNDVKNDNIKLLVNHESAFKPRIEALERDAAAFKASLRVGKGLVIGVFVTVGSFGIIAYDKLREAVLTVIKLI